MRNPFVLTRAPRIFAGEASDMYKGEVMEAIPTPSPTKTRPTMRRAGPGAAAMTTAPMKKRKSAMRIALRLPYRSFIHPPIAAPIMAPAIAMLTIVSCLMFIPSTTWCSVALLNWNYNLWVEVLNFQWGWFFQDLEAEISAILGWRRIGVDGFKSMINEAISLWPFDSILSLETNSFTISLLLFSKLFKILIQKIETKKI